MMCGTADLLTEYKCDRVEIALDVLRGKLLANEFVDEALNDTARWAAEVRFKLENNKQ